MAALIPWFQRRGRTALHPRLQQPMRILDSAIFQADHDDWHLSRIRDLSRR